MRHIGIIVTAARAPDRNKLFRYHICRYLLQAQPGAEIEQIQPEVTASSDQNPTVFGVSVPQYPDTTHSCIHCDLWQFLTTRALFLLLLVPANGDDTVKLSSIITTFTRRNGANGLHEIVVDCWFSG